MPLLDHFRPPLSDEIQWNTLFHGWAVRITDAVFDRLPPGIRAAEYLRPAGCVDVDITSIGHGRSADGWKPPPASGTLPATFTDRYEIHVAGESWQPAAVVALVCPTHKTDPAHRRAFVSSVVSLLHSGVCVAIIDIVTGGGETLHASIGDTLGMPNMVVLPDRPDLYAATYAARMRGNKPVIEVWLESFGVGDPLPTMPLRLTDKWFVPVDFEVAYTETCRRRRLIP